MASDISYKVADQGRNYRFNYRVAAIIEFNQKILIHKFIEADYSFLPGGRVQIGEAAENAILRELSEELNIEAKVSALHFTAENFFDHGDETFHEISMFFGIDGRGLKLPENNEVRSGVQFFWREPDNLMDLNLQPEFLRKELVGLPRITKHIVNISSVVK